MSEQPLSGFTILVTRPQQQSDVLAGAIRKAGGEVLIAPMIAIRSIDDASAARAIIDRIDTFDIAIFTSRNAVDFTFALLREAGKDLRHVQVFSVGLGTAAQLRSHGVKDIGTPSADFSSEGLLELPALAKVGGKRIVIFRGETGRELLATELTARGAEISYCEVYQRYVPDTSLGSLLQQNGGQIPDVVVITSLECLRNLTDKIAAEQLDQFYAAQPLVVSQRIAREVETYPFTSKPLVVTNPADNRIVQALIAWADGAL